jgi:hypothetical protein
MALHRPPLLLLCTYWSDPYLEPHQLGPHFFAFCSNIAADFYSHSMIGAIDSDAHSSHHNEYGMLRASRREQFAASWLIVTLEAEKIDARAQRLIC